MPLVRLTVLDVILLPQWGVHVEIVALREMFNKNVEVYDLQAVKGACAAFAPLLRPTPTPLAIRIVAR